MKPLDAFRRARWLGALLLSVAVAACSGGDDPEPIPAGVSGTLSGTAATGAAISGGTVEVKCAAGPDPVPATSSAAGAWTVSVSGVTLPCKVKVSGGDLPSGAALHSIATDLGTVNVTPLTDLVVANLTGQSPTTWYANVTPGDLGKITAASVNAAVANIRTAINVAAFGDTVNPITTALAIGDAIDKVLDALKVAAPDYAALVAAAQGPGFATTFASTYASALNNALSGGGTGGGGNCPALPETIASKQIAMTFQDARAGAPYSNGKVLNFVFSSSGMLFVGEPGASVSTEFPAYTNDTLCRYLWSNPTFGPLTMILGSDGKIQTFALGGYGFDSPYLGEFVPSSGGTGGGTGFASGPGYALAYSAAKIGIDLRNPVTASFDSTTGELTGWVWPVNPAESPLIGTLSTSELAIDGALTLGRWNAGVLGGTYFTLPALSLTNSGGLHWVIGKPASSVPATGVVTYNLSKTTKPTIDNFGAVVVPLSGSVTVDFASGKVGVDLSYSADGTVYTVRTTGGTASTGSSEVSILADARGEFMGAGQFASAPNASGTVSKSTAYVSGFFAGASAGQIGLALRVDNSVGNYWFSMVGSFNQVSAGGGGTANPLLAAANCAPGITTGFSLVAEVTVAGVVAPPICVDGLSAKPATQAEFCGNSEFRQGLPPGVSIISCSYNPGSGVADVSATLSAAPGLPGVSYVVKYTFVPRT